MFISFRQFESLTDTLLEEGHPEILRVFHYGLPEDYDDPPDAEEEIAAHHAWIERHRDEPDAIWRVARDITIYVFEAERCVETGFHDAHPESEPLYDALTEAEVDGDFDREHPAIAPLSRDLATLPSPHAAPMRVLLAACTGDASDTLEAATAWTEAFTRAHSGLRDEEAIACMTHAIQGDLLLAIDIEDPYT